MNHDFGWAIRAMVEGHKLFREGWNGKGMWIAIQFPDAHSKMTVPYIYMSTAKGNLVPWVISQEDALATDWNSVSIEKTWALDS